MGDSELETLDLLLRLGLELQLLLELLPLLLELELRLLQVGIEASELLLGLCLQVALKL